MATVYDLAVRIGLQTSGFGGVGGIVTQLAALARQASVTSGAVVDVGASLGKIAAGAAITGVGVAGAMMMKDWVGNAATMQDALTQVGIAAKLSQADLAKLHDQAFGIAAQTQYSVNDILKMEQLMGQMGFRDPTGHMSREQVISAAVGDFARAAEVLQHITGAGYDQTVTALTQQAHMLGAYSGAALSENVALATGAALESHMSPQVQANVLRFLSPARATLGLSNQEVFALAALGNQTGQTQRGGGAAIGTLLRELQDTGAKKHDDALAQVRQIAHGTFFNAQGQFLGLENAMEVLNRFYTATGVSEAQRNLVATQAFTATGARIAPVFGMTTSLEQFRNILADMSKYTPAWLKGAQDKENATLIGQLNTLKTDFQSIGTIMGEALLPGVLRVTGAFRQLAGGVLDFLIHHKDVAQFAATFVAVATAAALIAGPILIAAGAFGLLAMAGVFTAGVMLPFIGIVAGITIGVAAVTFAIMHWNDITQFLGTTLGKIVSVAGLAAAIFFAWGPIAGIIGAIGTAVDFAAVAFGVLDLALAPITLPIILIAAAVAGAILLFTHWTDVTKALGGAFEWVGTKIHDFLVWAGLASNSAPGGPVPPDAKAAKVLRGGWDNSGWGIGGGSVPHPLVPHRAGGGSTSHMTLHIHPDAIKVYPAPGQSEETIAQRVHDLIVEKFGDSHRWQSSTPYATDLGFHGV